MNYLNPVIQTMIWELNHGYQDLLEVLDTLTKEEAQWMPTSNSRTLDIIQNWNRYGNGWIEEQKLDPISTIEYLTIHIAQCKLMYNEYAFREAKLQWKELECPEWPESKHYLKKTQEKLLESTKGISDKELEKKVKTNWGDSWPIKKIIFTLIHHDAYHLGQINTIRNLYRIHNQ